MDLRNLKKGEYIVLNRKPFIVKELELLLDTKKANVVLEDLFSGEMIRKSLSLDKEVHEAEIMRKCASIIAKRDHKLEIIDSVSFQTFDARIDDKLLEQAEENDQVTYLQFGKEAKVIEVRKQ